MALDRQNVNVPLAGGLDTKTDPKQVTLGKLDVVENGIFTETGALRKRAGTQDLNSDVRVLATSSMNAIPPKLTAGNFVTTFQEELVVGDGLNLYSYSPAGQVWDYKGALDLFQVTTQAVCRNTAHFTSNPDSATAGGLQLFAWTETASATPTTFFSIVDTSTQQVIINRTSIGSGTVMPRCAAIAGILVLFYADTATNHINYFIFGPFGQTVGSGTAATNFTTSGASFDLTVSPGAIYLAWPTSTGVSVTSFNSTLVQGPVLSKTATVLSAVTVARCAVDASIWVAYNTSSVIAAFVVDSTLTLTLLAPTTIETVAATGHVTLQIDSTKTARVLYDLKGSAVTQNGTSYFSNAQVRYNTLTQAGTAGTPGIWLQGVLLASKVFYVPSPASVTPVYRVIVAQDSALQPSYFVTSFYNVPGTILGRVTGRVFPSTSGTASTAGPLSSVTVAGTDVQLALLQVEALFSGLTTTGEVNTFTLAGVSVVSLDFDYTNTQTVLLGKNLQVAGAQVNMYDGYNVVEHGFQLFPELSDSAITVTGTSGGLSAGLYGYQVTYEWTDLQGQVHRSAPSAVYSKTASSTNTATIVVPNLRLTSKQNVNIVLYRTAVNGSVYYRLTSPAAPIINDPTSNTPVSITDAAADTAILANQQLYTTGGEIENICAPPALSFATYMNRVLLVAADDPSTFWYSKQVVEGAPVEFTDSFTQFTGSDSTGPLVALAQMDDKLILFKENSVFYVTGQGPSPSGLNNDFTNAMLIAADAGCISPQSVVLTPMGLMFQSNKGIYLLSRSLETQYIGADVEAYNSQSVTSAQLIPNTQQVRMTLSDRITLVYDYFYSRWATYTNYGAVSSTLWNNSFTFLRSSAPAVSSEVSGSFVDNGQHVKLKLTTNWLTFAGLQGFQRLYKALILGEYFGPHQLLVSLAYDFDSNIIQQDYINAGNLLNSGAFGADTVYGASSVFGGAYPLYQWRVFPARQKCDAIQITLEDVQVLSVQTGAVYNEGLSLSSMALEVGVKKGLNKLPASRSFG